MVLMNGVYCLMVGYIISIFLGCSVGFWFSNLSKCLWRCCIFCNLLCVEFIIMLWLFVC